MSTPPIPQRMVSQRGVLSRAPGAIHLPSGPMVAAAGGWPGPRPPMAVCRQRRNGREMALCAPYERVSNVSASSVAFGRVLASVASVSAKERAARE